MAARRPCGGSCPPPLGAASCPTRSLSRQSLFGQRAPDNGDPYLPDVRPWAPLMRSDRPQPPTVFVFGELIRGRPDTGSLALCRQQLLICGGGKHGEGRREEDGR